MWPQTIKSPFVLRMNKNYVRHTNSIYTGIELNIYTTTLRFSLRDAFKCIRVMEKSIIQVLWVDAECEVVSFFFFVAGFVYV